MDFNGDWDHYDEDEVAEFEDRATILPTEDEVWDTLVLMRLEAGVISDEDLPDLDWDNLPEMPEDMEDRDEAMHLALASYEFQYEDPEAAEEMARRATEVDPYCIEGWVALWAMQDVASEEALIAAGKGVVYGKHLIDATKDIRFVDDIWQYPRIRGAVRAYAALAFTNWAQGNNQDAFDAAEEVLRLAPNDQVQMAPYLVNWYLAAGRIKRAHRLLRDISIENNAAVAYARALTEFARSGPEKAHAKLLTATEAHPLILGAFVHAADGIIPPTDEPYPFDTYSPGTFEDVAVWYELITQAWENVEGAMDWALRCAEEPKLQALIEEAVDQTTSELSEIGNLLEALGDVDLDDEDDSPWDPDLRLM